MINRNDVYAIYAYEQGWELWERLRNRFEDLTYSDRFFRLGYLTAMRQENT